MMELETQNTDQCPFLNTARIWGQEFRRIQLHSISSSPRTRSTLNKATAILDHIRVMLRCSHKAIKGRSRIRLHGWVIELAQMLLKETVPCLNSNLQGINQQAHSNSTAALRRSLGTLLLYITDDTSEL